MPTLTYDDLPLGSDLAHEFADGGGVTITAAVREPSARAVRWVRRRAAARAAGDTAIAAVVGLALFLLLPLYTPRQRFEPLPLAVYPLLGVLGAAVYLMAWQIRFGHCRDALDVARRQVTVITADAASLRVETDGPMGAHSHRTSASDVVGVTSVAQAKQPWHSMRRHVVRITLIGGREIDLLAGRDESELAWAAAVLRRALNAPSPVVVSVHRLRKSI
jgi:hypothetical protein